MSIRIKAQQGRVIKVVHFDHLKPCTIKPQGLGKKADTQPSTSDTVHKSCQQTVPQQSTGDELILADSSTEKDLDEVQHEQEDSLQSKSLGFLTV